MPNIYDYTDFRAYLADVRREKRLESRAFSYRAVAARLNSASPSAFYRIVHGKTKVTGAVMVKLTQLFGLDMDEAEYFELLVDFGQAPTLAERRYYLARMSHARHARALTLGPHQYEYYAKWYYPIVRAALGCCDIKDNYKALGAVLRPPVGALEARQAVRLLAGLGLVGRNAEGYWRPTDGAVTSGGDETVMVAAKEHTMAMIDRAAEALTRFPREDREIATLTVTVSRGMVRHIMDEIKAFRRKAASMVHEDRHARKVYQLNTQVFPVARVEGNGRARNRG